MSDDAFTPAPAAAACTPAGWQTSDTLTLILWLLLQLAALALAAARVPFSAQHPEPEEDLAVAILVAVQHSAAALLAPRLMRHATLSVLAIAPVMPLLILAGLLAQTAPAPLAAAVTLTLMWLITLALATAALGDRRALVAPCAVALALGGVLAGYVGAEAGSTSPLQRSGIGPLATTLRALQHPAHLPAWIQAGVLLGAGLLGTIPRLRRR